MLRVSDRAQEDRWLPLSARHNPERAKDFEILSEGVPKWLHESLIHWIGAFVNARWMNNLGSERWDWHTLRASMQAALHEPIPSQIKDIPADVCLNILDYIIRYENVSSNELANLEILLSSGGSIWRVTPQSLEKRVDGTLQLVAESVFETKTRPASHLKDSWHKAWGRNPDASGAYREAVRAVEAAYAPIVSPRNARATLGTIISDIRNKPSKFRVRLQADEPCDNVEQIAGMLQMLWKSQSDRHGTASEDVPLNVRTEEARDAVVLATTLVHLAQQGGFTTSGN